jgi:hypothetical protein
VGPREGFDAKIQCGIQMRNLAENIVVGYEPLNIRHLKYHDMPQVRRYEHRGPTSGIMTLKLFYNVHTVRDARNVRISGIFHEKFRELGKKKEERRNGWNLE